MEQRVSIITLGVGDLRRSREFYERLGFTQTATADTYSHPYGVLTDGSLNYVAIVDLDGLLKAPRTGHTVNSPLPAGLITYVKL